MQYDFELPKPKRKSSAVNRWQKRYLTKGIRLVIWLNLLVLLLCVLTWALAIGLSKLGIPSIEIDTDNKQLMALLALGVLGVIVRPRKRKKNPQNYYRKTFF